MNIIVQEFLDQSIFRINESTPKIIKCLDALSEEQIWVRPNEVSNSIGNIILHLCGNIRQYIISALGDEPDIRERDKEFSARSGYSKKELQVKLVATVKEAVNVIQNIDEKRLVKIFLCRDSTFRVLALLFMLQNITPTIQGRSSSGQNC